MNTLRHFELGESYPASPHAVVSSLPTMADVCAYEEKDSEVLSKLKSGYPRFVEHPFVRQLIAHYCTIEQLPDRLGRLIPGRRAVNNCLEHIGDNYIVREVEPDLYLVASRKTDESARDRLLKHCQHTGCAISSRQAHDLLIQHQLIAEPFIEATNKNATQQSLEESVAATIGAPASDVLVCSSGMNAVYSAIRSIQDAQYSNGRKSWLQIGWLYLDSSCLLEKYLREDEHVDRLIGVQSTEAICDRIAAIGEDLSGVVVECPSNPTLGVFDLEAIYAAVKKAGGMVIADPTIASVFNINVLPYCDLLTTSMTKYVCFKGDVMIGALVVNRSSARYADLIGRVSAFHQPPYQGDLQRCAWQLDRAASQVAQMASNAQRVAQFLREHPRVSKIVYPHDHVSINRYAKSKHPAGAVITFSVSGNVAAFYDSLAMMKGPSFGTDYSILSPFLYLAHYDWVTSPDRRTELRSYGMDPELLRLSVGCESIDDIIGVLDDALCSEELVT